MITVKTFPCDAIIRTAGKDIIKGKTQEESIVNMTGATTQARLNRILHVPNVKNSLNSGSRLCGDGHTVEFSEKNYIVKNNGNVIAVGERTSGIYLVELRGDGEKAMTSSEVSEKM